MCGLPGGAAVTLSGLLVLLGCELVAEILRQAFALPAPAPVIGLFLLAAGLAARDRSAKACDAARPSVLEKTADGLIANMGLLFVPAGVGVITQIDLLRQSWAPVVVALCGSTLLGLIVTGVVMHRFGQWLDGRQTASPAVVGRRQESRP
jgi:putative effector of murein hydrolase LrgA (UPF0299 family)